MFYLNFIIFLVFRFCFCTLTGKGDLVGCDISMHLLASSNGQGGSAQHGTSGGQDVLVKSSSDVKVCLRSTIINIIPLDTEAI